MLETTIERRLTQRVQERGGLCYKFVSPGNVGVPDRIVITPEGGVFFVELKSKSGRLAPMQKYRRAELAARKVEVRVLNSVEGVENFVGEVMPL